MLAKEFYTKSIVNQHSDAVIIIDLLSYKILFASEEFCKSFGYENQELETLFFWEILKKEEYDRSKIKFFSGLKNDRNEEKFQVLAKNKEVLIVDIRRSIVDFGGKTSLCAVFLKRAKQIKTEEYFNKRLNDLFCNNSIEIFWLQNFSNSQEIFVSNAYDDIFGRPVDSKVEGEILFEKYVHPDDKCHYSLKMEEYRNQGKVHFEFRILMPDGAVKLLSANYFKTYNSFGIIDGNAGTVIDITHKKQSEILIKENDLFFSTIFYNDSSAMLLIDLKSKMVTDSNEAAERYFDYSKEELLEKTFDDIFESNIELYEIDNFVSNTGKLNLKSKSKKADGSVQDFEGLFNLIRIEDREVIHVIIRDISESIKLKKLIEAQDSVLKEIAWAQSHSLRGPLTRIMSLLSFIKESDVNNICTIDIIDELMNNGLEMDKVIKEISNKIFQVRHFNSELIDITETNIDVDFNDFNLILLDDDVLIHKMNRHVITRSNFHSKPISFFHGQEALDFIRENQNPKTPFLIFLDINMPEMDGWQFLDALQKEKFNSPISVIILSSSIDIEDRLKSKDYNPVLGFLSKPLKIQDLNRLPLNTDARSFHTNVNEVVSRSRGQI